jgi:hypothetical protein
MVGRGGALEDWGALGVNLGHAMDVLRRDEPTKMVNRIEVRVTLLAPWIFPHD